jgi:transcriptional regulator GlxA family with amidase domain
MRTTAKKEDKRLTIGFILARSFTLSAFSMFIDTIRLASDELDRSGRVFADWQVLASTQHLITSSCGVKVAPTSALSSPDQFDYIVVVGGLLNVESPLDAETRAYLAQAARLGVTLIGLCTGSFILADIGLMRKHKACVSWLHYKSYRERFPDHPVESEKIFNLEEDRGSCAGGSGSADMAAFLVRSHISKDAERNALEVMQIQRARAGTDIQPRRPLSEAYQDPRLCSALILMEQHIDDELTIDNIADAVGISRRQLERLFLVETGTSPAQAYTTLRMKKARTLVLHTRASFVDIANDVGFNNASHFSRAFRRLYGISPSKVRSAAQLWETE